MSGNEERFQQAMNQGHSAAWDQLWDRAAAFYRQALEEFPDHPKTLTSLGLAMYQLQDYKEALRYYQQATKVIPDDPVPFEKVAELHERLGNLEQAADIFMKAAELYAKNRDVDKAIEAWTRVTGLNPENLMAHSRLAVVFERLGRKQQAVTEYLAIASLMQHSGEIPKAVQTLTHAIQVLPGSNEAGQALAYIKSGQLLPKPIRPRGVTGPLLMAQVKKLEKSKTADSAAPGLDPIEAARQKALTDLAGILFEQEDPEEQSARRGLQAIVQGTGQLFLKADHSKIVLHLTQVIDLQARGKSAEAIDELERAMEAGLDNPAADFDLGLLMSDVGRLESAIRHLQRAANHGDYGLGARLLLGKILEKMDRIKEAAVNYMEALELADSTIVPAGQAEELRQLYEPLVESQTQQTNMETQQRLCSNIKEMLMRPDWREHMARARQQLPAQMEGGPPVPLAEILTEARGNRVVEAVNKIHQYARTGNYRAAMEEAYYALQQAPTYLPLHTYIGELLLQQNQVQYAVDKFTVVALSYSTRGDAARAVDMFRRVIELAPMEMKARSRLIDQLIAMGRMEDAISEYLNLADVYYNLADLIMARKTYTNALRLAQQGTIDRKWKVMILHRMADIDVQSLDWRQALRVYEQIRTLQPDDDKARSSLIDLNFRLGQTPQAVAELDSFITFLWSNGQKNKAVEYVENLVKENPRQPMIRRRMADLYRQTGRVTDAIEELDAAGDLLIDAGDKAGATEVVLAILGMNPPNTAEYQQLLAQLKAG